MKSYILIISALFFTLFAQAKVYKVLFIGNSYVAYNDLPNTFKSICTSMGDSVMVDANNPGGYSFNTHSTDATTLAKIQIGNWDYVILQGQSQEPSFSPGQVQTNTYPYAKKLDSLVKAYNACAEVVFYMTWGRKYGDASNCTNYPPICTYNGMQQRLRESYSEMAMDNNSSVCPAGIVWKKVREIDSTIELYNPDLSHPSVAGTYLVASSFYASFFHKQFTNATFISGGVSTAHATIIQNAVRQIVLDSIDSWQQYGTIPNANFIITTNTNPIGISNTSLRHTSSNWVFGDGLSSTTNANTITHTYANDGAYTVLLTAQNACGKIDTAMNIIGINTHLSNLAFDKNNLKMYQTANTIWIENIQNGSTFKLYSIDGKMVYQQKITDGQIYFNTCSFASTLFIYHILNNNKLMMVGKLKW